MEGDWVVPPLSHDPGPVEFSERAHHRRPFSISSLLRSNPLILSWIEGRPAAMPFWMVCAWLDISPQAARERLERVAANPDAYREPLRLVGTARRGGDINTRSPQNLG